MVVTFYSFKGGVGRSMALVNVGEIFADWGYRVVLCDWDLEAPGLERYLVNSSPRDKERYKQEVAELLAKDGLMDMLREYKETLTQPASESQRQVTEKAAQGSGDVTSRYQKMGDLLLRRPFSYTCPVFFATPSPRTGWLRLMTVGRRDGDANQERYAEMVRSFDWDEFYEKWAGDRYMELFREDLESSSDIVLIDSRTGVTEQGGVCTHHLADLVVLFSAANEMNLEGTKWMARILSDPRLEKLRGERQLKVLPVASRIEWLAQKEELVDFENRFRSEFRRYVPDAVAEPDTFLLKSEIPYSSFYSFYERVVAREPKERRESRLYAAYETLADAIARFGKRCGKLTALRSEGGVTVATPAPPTSRTEPPRGPIFVSYSFEDQRIGHLLAMGLRSLGVEVVESVSGSGPDVAGEQWGPQAIVSSAGCVAVLGHGGSDSGQQAELEYILRRQVLQPNLRIVPVLLPSSGATKPISFSLDRFRALSVPENLSPSDAEFFSSLGAELATASAPPPTVEESGNPFRPFNETGARFFFGRDGEIEKVLRGVRQKSPPCRWIQIEGPSGSGKSSLAWAGLLPAARAGWISGVSRGCVAAVCQPGSDPVADLAAALEPLVTIPRPDLISRLQSSFTALRDVIGEATGGRTFLLLVDPMDPVLDLDGKNGGGQESARHFIALLGEAVNDPKLPFFLITTVRNDLLARLSGLPRIQDAFNKWTFRYVPASMNDQDLVEMLSGTTRMAGLVWESGLMDRVLGDARSARELPFFTHELLLRLWEARQGNLLTHEAYQKLGGLSGVMAARVRDVFEGLAEDDARRAKSLLVRLMSANGTRLTVSLGEARDMIGPGLQAEDLLTALARGSLVTINEESIQLSHDALISPGSIIRSWFDAQRETFKRRSELEDAALVWEAAGRPEGGLPTGGQLTYFKKAVGISKKASQFLAEADKHEKILRHRRSWFRWSAASTIMLLILSIGAALEVGQVSKRRMAAEVQAVDAYTAAETEPLGALVLAIRAAQMDQGELTKLALWQAIQNSYLFAAFPGLFEHWGKVVSTEFSPDGNRVLCASVDGKVSVWETATGRGIFSLVANESGAQQSGAAPSEPTNAITSAQFSPDGRQVVVSSADHTACIRDAMTGREPLVLRGHSNAVTDAAFSPDGRRVVTASVDRTAKIWDVASGREIITLAGHTAAVSGASFSPNGTQVVTASDDQSARIWDASSGKMLFVLRSFAPVAVATFSADGQRVLTVAGVAPRLWDASTGKLMGFYRCNGTCTTGAFSPNGRLILVGTTDGVATIFDLSTRSPVADLRGHTGSVLGVVFGPDGRQAVTTGGDGTVQVWDVQKGRQLRVLRGHDAPVTRVAFSPNGRLIATAGDDGTVRLWTTDEPPPRDNSMSFADLVRLATSRLPVTLNSNERARLLLVTERTRGATSR